MKDLARTLLGFATAVLLLAPGAAVGQLPEEFTNLQFFPEDIAQGELVGHMRGFSLATGLRCTGCHVGEEGQPFTTFDFASDEKVLKRKARAMLEMTRDINEDHLASLVGRRADQLGVTCATCHGGVRRPVPITDIVAETLEEDGIEEAVTEYRRLRNVYYGTRAYDFGERPLLDLAQGVASSGDVDGGLALLELNLEFFEESDQSFTLIGEIHRSTGDTARALEAYRRALEINPRNPIAQRRIQELTGA